eukprot:jgi/Bigna1/133259/aug1.20_g7967
MGRGLTFPLNRLHGGCGGGGDGDGDGGGSNNIGPYRSGLGPLAPYDVFDPAEERLQRSENKRMSRRIRSAKQGRFVKDLHSWYAANFSTTADPSSRLEKHYDRWEAIAQDVSSDVKTFGSSDRPADYLDDDEDEEEDNNATYLQEREGEDKEQQNQPQPPAREDAERSNKDRRKWEAANDDNTVQQHQPKAEGSEYNDGNDRKNSQRQSIAEEASKRLRREKLGIRQTRNQRKLGHGKDEIDDDKSVYEDLDEAFHDPGFEKWLQDHPKRYEFAATIARDILNQTEGIPPMEEIAEKLRKSEARDAHTREGHLCDEQE